MAYRVTEEEFEGYVADALDTLPDEYARHLANVVILVRDRNEDEPELLGLYQGIPLPERTFDHTGYLPDTIEVYREALCEFCSSEEELRHEVHVTVMHEVGHYFGMSEEDLHSLGWG